MTFTDFLSILLTTIVQFSNGPSTKHLDNFWSLFQIGELLNLQLHGVYKL